MRAAVERLGQVDLLVVGSPTYKASFSGLLKAFFDPLDSAQFRGKLAIPVMMGGSELHALAVETALRPLLVEVGATVATPGLYVVESRIEEIETIAAEYAGRVLPRSDARAEQSGACTRWWRRWTAWTGAGPGFGC